MSSPQQTLFWSTGGTEHRIDLSPAHQKAVTPDDVTEWMQAGSAVAFQTQATVDLPSGEVVTAVIPHFVNFGLVVSARLVSVER